MPEFISIGEMLKATPREDGGRRIIYFEASNEGLDAQGEIVAAQALAKSADFYRRFGNVDISHLTMIGAKAGIPDCHLYEIGLPVEVGQMNGSTFVKAELYRGEGPTAKQANIVWSGLTEVTPPKRWYPSVGGKVLGKAVERNDDGSKGRTLITHVQWSNVALAPAPVNQHLAECATMPIGVFAKAWGAGGLDLALAKTLTAGYGTDSANLSGGAALRIQSLDGGRGRLVSYQDFRERMASALKKGACGQRPGLADLQTYAHRAFDLSEDEAAQHVERFARDLSTNLKRRVAA